MGYYIPSPPLANLGTDRLEHLKAHLVVQGYKQQQRINFDETFTHVVKLTTIQTVILVDLSSRWTFRQLDVKNTFPHGVLNEETRSNHRALSTHHFLIMFASSGELFIVLNRHLVHGFSNSHLSYLTMG